MIRVLIVDDDKLVRKGLISSMPWHEKIRHGGCRRGQKRGKGARICEKSSG